MITNIEVKIHDFTYMILATNVSVNAKLNKIKSKTLIFTNWGTNVSLNPKINEVKGKIVYITNLATTIAVTAIENKIPSVSNLPKKLTITHKLVKLKIKLLLIMIMINSEESSARLKQANLATKNKVTNFLKMTSLLKN